MTITPLSNTQRRWVAEYCKRLESGAYIQTATGLMWYDYIRPTGSNMLQQVYHYDALGVACQLFCDVHGTDWEVKHVPGVMGGWGILYGHTGTLPPDVVNFFGFDRPDPLLDFGDHGWMLMTDACDRDPWFTFAEIAEAIRRTYGIAGGLHAAA